jgi:hypothetical protein
MAPCYLQQKIFIVQKLEAFWHPQLEIQGEGWIFFSLSNIPEQFSTRRHSLVSRYLLISLL